MILNKDFIFISKRLTGIKHTGLYLEIDNGRCLIKQGAYCNGATLARDENAFFAWMWHDNAYCDKMLPISRLTKDLIMYDLLKAEGFRWFRWKWLKKIFKNYNGINMIWAYFIGVRLFGWTRHVK